YSLFVLIIPCNVQYLTRRFAFPSLNLYNKPPREKVGFGEVATFSTICYCSFFPGWFFPHLPLASRCAIYHFVNFLKSTI
uniref:Uncharacterized protein n=1 Tax=Athene cunicularia TaxID=194338 RepID=A0A663LP13_ATHCN